MNAVENSLYIFMLFMVLFGFAIGFTILDNMYNTTKDVIEAQDIILPEEYDVYASTTGIIKYGMEFLLVLSIVILLVSSAIEQKSITGYIMGFIGSVIITSVMIFFTSQVYNFVLLGGDLVDLSIIPEWFLTNMNNIFFYNVLAGLFSFAFTLLRGKSGAVEYAV
jgi:hypothetical protein